MRARPSCSASDDALRTTRTPAADALCRNLPRTLTAEKSKPDTAFRSSIRQIGAEAPARDCFNRSVSGQALPKNRYPRSR